MSNNDTISKTLIVALSLCIVCSVVVSIAAVSLKPEQTANKTLDRKYNILAAADLIGEDKSKAVIEELFTKVETRLVDLNSGKFAGGAEEAAAYNQKAAAKDKAQSTSFDELGAEDTAKIGRRVDLSLVYLVKGEGGQVDKVILPIHGYGLWSTLYGFIALEGDLNTVIGLGFNEHAETPGLGGEVDNPLWKSKWGGKQAYGQDGSVILSVTKGTAPVGSNHEVDGLSGATLTSRGVNNLVQFWLGEKGFAPFLRNLKNGEA